MAAKKKGKGSGGEDVKTPELSPYVLERIRELSAEHGWDEQAIAEVVAEAMAEKKKPTRPRC